MKIEMGESLMYSWLRHVCGCQIAQLNWKSINRESVSEPLIALFDTLRIKYDIKSNLSQFLRQSEIDVLGIKIEGGVPQIFAVDIAFHEAGLGYKNSIEKITKKMISSAFSLISQFGDQSGKIIFASPKVRESISGDLEKMKVELESIFNQAGYHFSFSFLFNESFKKEVLDTVIKKSSDVKDMSDLFIRSLKMMAIFQVSSQRLRLEEVLNLNTNLDEEENTVKDVDDPSTASDLSIDQTYKSLYEIYNNNPETKPGAFMSLFFEKLNNDGKLEELVDKELNMKVGSYDLIKEINNGQSIDQLKKGNDGRSRYWASPFIHGNRSFLICSQWFKEKHAQNKELLMNIIKELRLE